MRFVAVPIKVDGLWLTHDQNVAGPSADFTRLPYVDAITGHDVHPEEPYLSGALLPDPFTEGLRLRAGLHLHWSLPDALTRLVHQPGGATSGNQPGAATSGNQPGGATGDRPEVDLPRVPNRWLVTRSRPGGAQDRWVVESDALSDIDRGGVPYPPLAGDPRGGTGRPYRFLGRTLPLSAWPGGPADRLGGLTAIGYGEPTFAAFYPNSHSVFGFHDDDLGADPATGTGPLKGLRYDVLGWYADPSDDELLTVLAAGGGQWWDLLANRLSWSVPVGAGPAPDRLLCFGRLTFAPGNPSGSAPAADPEAGLWVADTATEALAAHLGAALPGVTEDQVENLLEALTVADELESASLDLVDRLAEARHTASFTPVAAGIAWTVRRHDDPVGTAPDGTARPITAEQRQRREGLRLPEGIDDLLAALTAAQSAYDDAVNHATSLRERLFADWHRYLACAYPPDQGRADYPDPALVGLRLRQGVEELTALARLTGSYPPVGPGTSLAHRLLAARTAVERALTAVNALAEQAGSRFLPVPVPADPYHLPNEPVVLLTGPAATPSDRYGQDGDDQPDGLLPCQVLDADRVTPADLATAAGIGTLADQVARLAEKLPDPHPALRRWTAQPWHPVLMVWEVEFFPSREGNNLDPADRNFDPGFVTDTYRLADGDTELRPRGAEVLDKAANVYTGSTVLSSSTRPLLTGRILRYLKSSPLAGFNDARREVDEPPLSPEQIDADPTILLDWCAGPAGEARLRTLAVAYRHLLAHEESNLAQSLGGFNDALLMLRLVRQLPIADPLGFRSGQDLAALVDAAVGGQGRRAPVPMSDFNPIRAGAMRLRRLRIVDSFGVGYDVDTTAPHTTARLRVANRPTWVALPPRLAVPARLRLDLLDAEQPDRPCAGLPTASPICGWLLPDTLDDGLRAYAGTGDWLGTLYPLPDPVRPAAAYWAPAPGTANTVDGIANPRLRAVVQWLRARGPDGLAAFLGGLDDALESVEPEEPAQQRAWAALLGRPVAVLRLAVGLHAAGLSATHQDWNVFRQDLNRNGWETNDYPLVRFPVRVGEPGRLGDGTLGYWLEQEDGLGTTYHDPARLAAAGADSPVELGIDLPDRTLTVLLAPTGSIHATSGILPTGSVRLTDDQMHAALAGLETGFLAAPVLTEADTVDLVRSSPPGRTWTWRERVGTAWTEVGDPPALRDGIPATLTAREGWLSLRETPTN
ncbi:hypothetical protein ACN28C_25060 [Plantactinospora sp. WMMC1484]|uniref:hypothetical protein n=1 Tax=Plantactinospora sp. WMMC1484 TaxID=3404122 RepID=UPI003BF4719A